MHPDNNPLDLAAGQLFLKDPETGATVPCEIKLGSGETLAEFTIMDIDDPEELKARAVEHLKQMAQAITIELAATAWLEQIVDEQYAAWLEQIVDEQYAACIKWAKEHRKKWLHIGRTTKKRRTRKKYARLIWREYKAAQAAALARIAGEV